MKYRARIAPSKYRNVRTIADGHSFASGMEAKRYQELKLLQDNGDIGDLKLQPRFPITVNGTPICTYVADFKYLDQDMVEVVEDVKGVRTPLYRVKKALMMAVYGIDVKET